MGPNRVVDEPIDLNASEHIRADVAILNCLYTLELNRINLLGSAAVESAIHNAKVALLLGGWQPDWGGNSERQALAIPDMNKAGQKAADLYGATNPRCSTIEGTLK